MKMQEAHHDYNTLVHIKISSSYALKRKEEKVKAAKLIRMRAVTGKEQ